MMQNSSGEHCQIICLLAALCSQQGPYTFTITKTWADILKVPVVTQELGSLKDNSNWLLMLTGYWLLCQICDWTRNQIATDESLHHYDFFLVEGYIRYRNGSNNKVPLQTTMPFIFLHKLQY